VRSSTRGRAGPGTRAKPSTIHTEPNAICKQPGRCNCGVRGFAGALYLSICPVKGLQSIDVQQFSGGIRAQNIPRGPPYPAEFAGYIALAVTGMTDQESKISKIRALLNELESEKASSDDAAFSHNFDALEIPSIVASVVDLLQPQLLPYEAAIYWHLFRKSILENGEQYARVSVRSMQQGVVTSSSGQTSSLSYSSVQDALAGLERKGAIAKAGDTTREGTPYKVYIPEEIAICQELKASLAAEQSDQKPVDVRRDLDYYNVLENRLKVFERDNYKCHYCQKQLTRFTATLDHIQPVSRGGDNSFENLVTACLHCNSRRGNRAVMDMYQENGAGNR
jgi:hypothetical protein